MLSRVEKFDSGWVGLTLELNDNDVDKLIERLNDLKSRRIGHFHIRNDDFSGDTGMADIELSLSDDSSIGNMSVE